MYIRFEQDSLCFMPSLSWTAPERSLDLIMRPSGTSSTRNSVLEDHLAIIYRRKGMKHFKKIDLYVDLPMLKLQDLGTTCKKWLNKGVDEVIILRGL